MSLQKAISGGVVEDVLCIRVVGENVEVAISYVLYVVVKRVIGQYERNAVIAGCVVQWKKGVILRKIPNLYLNKCGGDGGVRSILYKD